MLCAERSTASIDKFLKKEIRRGEVRCSKDAARTSSRSVLTGTYQPSRTSPDNETRAVPAKLAPQVPREERASAIPNMRRQSLS